MYSWSMIAGLMSVLVTTMVINISRYTHASPPPTFICALITLPVIQIMLFLPQVKTEVKKNISKLAIKHEEFYYCYILYENL
jgi:hypothetical protein